MHARARQSGSVLEPASRAGFTLFEAMAVIALIGVVSAIAAPTIHSAIVERRVQRGAIDLVRVVRRGRSEALYTGRAHVLHFVSTGRGSATLFRGRTGTCNGNDWAAIIGDGSCTGINCVDQLDMNESRFALGSSTITMADNGGASPIQICFEPFGATRHRSGGSIAAAAPFTEANTIGGGFIFDFQRLDSGTAEGVARHVLVPLGTDARIVR